MRKRFPPTIIPPLLILLLFSCKSTPTRTGIIEMVKVNGKEIPKINLGEVDDSATTIKLSDLFEDFRIIPLETKKEGLISYPGRICLTDHSIRFSFLSSAWDLRTSFLLKTAGIWALL